MWELTILHETALLDTASTFFGLARKDAAQRMTCADFERDVGSEMFLVKCSDGQLLGGANGGSGPSDPARVVLKDDVCRFIYDATRLTLSMSVNDRNCGVLFDAVPTGMFPVVILRGTRKSVRLLRALVSKEVCPEEKSRSQIPLRKTRRLCLRAHRLRNRREMRLVP